ncbi:MAG TPA: hypothetical protein VNS88_04100 [Nitrospiraceae bacterium]|nr:hypothetical protein [Nitrospiraceae bacterium]
MPIEDSPIALAARDELPETWAALLANPNFGEEALDRRLNTLMYRAFGTTLDESEQEDLSPAMISYLGKKLAIDIIIPGIDFWSKQALSLSAGERESKAYKDRAEDLKELRKQLVADAAALLPEVEVDLPWIPKKLGDTARVQQSGLLTPHVTADPMGFPSIYGPPEETTTG